MGLLNPTPDQRIGALYLWLAGHLTGEPPPAAVLIGSEHLATIDAALTELFASRKKLSRKGKGGRPAVCRCGHKRHAAQCQECECAEYVAEPMSGNAARKRKKQRNVVRESNG